MSADPIQTSGEAYEAATAGEAADRADAVKDALSAAERRLLDGFKRAEQAIREAVEALRQQSRTYSGPAGQKLEEAQQYVVERVKERPVTAALAGLGVGFLLGVILSNRGK